MDREAELAVVRRAYAKQILAAVRVDNVSLEAAFAAVRREDFLGPGPWPIMRYQDFYLPTPSDDPVYLYTDSLVGIDPARRINNGQPSLHAHLLAAAVPAKGEHVVHVGAGTGYYTAIMAEMVGAPGRVTGVEFDGQLARRAEANLAHYPNVTVIEGDGAAVRYDAADVIYVNAGATAPASAWLDRLTEGGRLILPLTTEQGFGKIEVEKVAQRGAVFQIGKRGTDFHAKWISPVAIFPCAGNRDDASEKALALALQTGEARKVTRLYRSEQVPDERCWLRGSGWCLAYS
ncbi:MAG TPA: methyltransferase domain-containing protein [Rhizomicrobium sp.]|jgi:protein-L-isoaspartate(D-aspartate) O-methyltransferase|nr:methyltransferase domain-containing protein [Rhizomicrobium sp.]